MAKERCNHKKRKYLHSFTQEDVYECKKCGKRTTIKKKLQNTITIF